MIATEIEKLERIVTIMQEDARMYKEDKRATKDQVRKSYLQGKIDYAEMIVYYVKDMLK